MRWRIIFMTSDGSATCIIEIAASPDNAGKGSNDPKPL
jgi:hypothetical protein